MRRLITSIAVTAACALAPLSALAGNQELAQQIAVALRDSGQLENYRIGVKYQDGTVWLRGEVDNQEQMNRALKLTFQAPGVERVVNNMTIARQREVPKSVSVTPPVAPPASAPVAPVQQRWSLQQASGALAGESLRRPAATTAARTPIGRIHGPSRSALLLERVVSEAAGSHTQAVQVGPPAVPQGGNQANALAATFMPGSVQRTTTNLAGPAGTIPQMAPIAAAGQPVPAPPMAIAAAAALPAMSVPATPIMPNGQPLLLTQAPTGPMPIGQAGGAPLPQYITPVAGTAAARYDQPYLPDYAWPSYSSYPNYASLTYPKQYSPTAWPYIGPFYPYPQVPLGWRKVTLEWHDGWWQLDFCDNAKKDWFSGLFHPPKIR